MAYKIRCILRRARNWIYRYSLATLLLVLYDRIHRKGITISSLFWFLFGRIGRHTGSWIASRSSFCSIKWPFSLMEFHKLTSYSDPSGI